MKFNTRGKTLFAEGGEGFIYELNQKSLAKIYKDKIDKIILRSIHKNIPIFFFDSLHKLLIYSIMYDDYYEEVCPLTAYLDNSATTRICDEALAKYNEISISCFGNLCF